MDTSLKKTIIDLLQKRMDKCTSEQFWAVATLSGLDAFVLIHRKLLLDTLPFWAPLLLITAPAIYACYFIIQRHRSYYFYKNHVSEVLKDEEDVPDFLATPSPKSWSNTLSGVIFYVGMVTMLWCVIFTVLWYHDESIECVINLLVLGQQVVDEVK